MFQNNAQREKTHFPTDYLFLQEISIMASSAADNLCSSPADRLKRMHLVGEQ